MFRALVIFAAVFSVVPFSFGESVVKVSDGDTITVLDADRHRTRVRLWGVDAPESKQAFGEASRRHLAEHIAGKEVRLELRGRDRYGRVLAVVWLGEENENLMQVRDGYAWHYVAFAKNAPEYADVKIPVVASRLSASGTLTPGGVDVAGLVSVRAPRDAFRALPRVGDFVFLDGRRFIVDAVEDLVGSPLVRLALR